MSRFPWSVSDDQPRHEIFVIQYQSINERFKSQRFDVCVQELHLFCSLSSQIPNLFISANLRHPGAKSLSLALLSPQTNYYLMLLWVLQAGIHLISFVKICTSDKCAQAQRKRLFVADQILSLKLEDAVRSEAVMSGLNRCLAAAWPPSSHADCVHGCFA